MHLKKRFPFNESNVIKKKTGKYMYCRQVDIKKICVGHVDFLRDVGRALLYWKRWVPIDFSPHIVQTFSLMIR